MKRRDSFFSKALYKTHSAAFTLSPRYQLLKIYDDLEINILMGTIYLKDMTQRVDYYLYLFADYLDKCAMHY